MLTRLSKANIFHSIFGCVLFFYIYLKKTHWILSRTCLVNWTATQKRDNIIIVYTTVHLSTIYTHMYNIPSYSDCICKRRTDPPRRRPATRKGRQKSLYFAPPAWPKSLHCYFNTYSKSLFRNTHYKNFTSSFSIFLNYSSNFEFSQ